MVDVIDQILDKGTEKRGSHPARDASSTKEKHAGAFCMHKVDDCGASIGIRIYEKEEQE